MSDYLQESKLRWWDEYCVACGKKTRDIATKLFIVPCRYSAYKDPDAQHLVVFRACADCHCKNEALDAAYKEIDSHPYLQELTPILYNY